MFEVEGAKLNLVDKAIVWQVSDDTHRFVMEVEEVQEFFKHVCNQGKQMVVVIANEAECPTFRVNLSMGMDNTIVVQGYFTNGSESESCTLIIDKDKIDDLLIKQA